MANYDSTVVGVPYLRVTEIRIDYPVGAMPSVVLVQVWAVRLAGGALAELGPAPELRGDCDLVAHGKDPVPLVSPTTGEPIGGSTSLNAVMVQILAIVRDIQTRQNA